MKSKPAPNFFVILALSLMLSNVASCTIFTPTPLPTATSTVTTTPTETSIPTPTEVTEQINGVAVHYYFDWVHFFPPEWLDSETRCLAVKFDFVEAPRVRSVINEFTSSYDSNFLSGHLKDIYLLKEFNCRGAPLGGSYGDSAVYLAVHTDYADTVLLSILHAEFSSILMLNHRSAFPEQEWLLQNPDGFVYSGDPYQFVQTPDVRNPTEELLEAGFLTGYNRASVEEDFNMLVEWLFTRETELCEIRSRYERINRKAELAIKFYASIGAGVEFSTCS